MSGWLTFQSENYPSISIQQSIEHKEYLRLAINGKAISPFTIKLSDLDNDEWLRQQLEFAKAMYPDNADIARLLDALPTE